MGLFRYIFFISFFTILIYGLEIDATHKECNILSSSYVLMSQKKYSINDILKTHKFKKFNKEYINKGFNKDINIWIKIEIKNISDKPLTRIIKVNNPLLEKIIFYDSKDNYKAHQKGMLYISKNQKSIYTIYKVTLLPKKIRKIYINISNTTTGLQFGIELIKPKIFEKRDLFEQFFIIFFIGMISAFLIYSITLFIYTKNRSYLLYAAYLFFLMYQQLTYVGFLPLYAPQWFVKFDNLIVVPKISFMIITAALFAKNFLKTSLFPKINNIYNFFIVLLIILMPIVGTKWFYMPEIIILIGFIFVIFNTYSSIYIYKRGNKQARFFIASWLFLITGYIIMIFDTLGFISIMHYFPELILFLTVLEALFLLLAFVDKIHILDIQKKELDKKLFDEMLKRHRIIEKEVDKKTKELKKVIQEKTTLLKELHHRVKNSLQLILSIIRLQRYSILNKTSREHFIKLEHRINSIAKSYDLLYKIDDISLIDMKEYITKLCEELKKGYLNDKTNIIYDIDIKLPINSAIYIGLIINEIITNSIKHSKNKNLNINIKFYNSAEKYILIIQDNGIGLTQTNKHNNSLGLNLINSLVLNQLNGTISLDSQNGVRIIIIF